MTKSPHADILQQIADEAKVNEYFFREFHGVHRGGFWQEFNSATDLYRFLSGGLLVFRKPRTITLAGIEFPEPMREAPRAGSRYFTVRTDGGFVDSCKWTDSPADKACLRSGVCQATEEGARLQLNAMIASVGGSLEGEA